MIDVIALLIVICFTFFGMRKGFWHYLLELLTLAFSSWISWLYYQENQRIISSFMVFAWVFLGLNLVRWLLLRKRKPSYSLPSLFGGSILGFIQGTLIAAMVILPLGFIPTSSLLGVNMAGRLQSSRAYQMLNRLFPVQKLPVIRNISCLTQVSRSQESRDRLAEDPQVQELLKHKSFQAILSDPNAVKQLESHNLLQMLKNPKIIELINDGEFLEKMLKIDFKKVMKGN